MILQLSLAVIPAILAITLHEAAHGYAAWALGDDTARRAGRLSLNPLAHVDRVGTILLPGFLLVSQLLTIGRVGFMFGWAKPVPVAAWKFRDPRRGMMAVAAAGPAMNFMLAWGGALALYATPLLPAQPRLLAVLFLFYFMLTNLALGLFNLLPIPPLDGGRIAVGLLPERMARVWARTERAGIIIVLLAIFLLPEVLRQFGIHFDPIRNGLGRAIEHAVGWVLYLAGSPPDAQLFLGDDANA
jgi:Zn-dependent protease